MGPCRPALKIRGQGGVENPRSGWQSLACKGVSAVELMDVALKGRRVSSRMFGILGMYTSRMNRLGTASGAGAFHRVVP